MPNDYLDALNSDDQDEEELDPQSDEKDDEEQKDDDTPSDEEDTESEDEDDSSEDDSDDDDSDSDEDDEEEDEDDPKLYDKDHPKKRFDGVFNAWQNDRRKLQDLEKQIKELKDNPGDKSPDAQASELNSLAQQVAKIIKDSEVDSRKQEDDLVRKEVDNMYEKSATNPKEYGDFDHKVVIPFMLDLAKKGIDVVNIDQGYALWKMQQTGTSKAQEKAKLNAKKELDRKKGAGAKTGGKASADTAGLRKYNAKEDKGKSYQELLEDGMKEMDSGQKT